MTNRSPARQAADPKPEPTITARFIVRETESPGGWAYYTMDMPASFLADAQRVRDHEPFGSVMGFLVHDLERAAQR